MGMPETRVRGSKEQALANARDLLEDDAELAAEQAHEVIRVDQSCAEAFRLLGMALRRQGDGREARKAEDEAIRLALLDPALFQATIAISENRLDTAEHLIRPHLHAQPDDAAALRMLAEIGARTGHFDAAENLLHKALAVAPEYPSAKSLLESTLRLRRRMTSRDPNSARSTLALSETADTPSLQDGADDYREALSLYQEALDRSPENYQNWVSYGHVLRTVGRQDDALAAYRRSIAIRPEFGHAWWAIADLKTTRIEDDDVGTMLVLLESPDADEDDRTCLHFTLGKAFEERGEIERSFHHYALGNSLRAESAKHDRHAVDRHVENSLKLFTHDYFETRAGQGFDARDPIFVIGMPRAGSTLIEQILSSHPLVEGTAELADINRLAKWLADGKNSINEDSPYLENLSALTAEEIKKMGQSYIWSTGLRRKTDRPYFIDKMPNNWLHVGFIFSILPNAKIIDARRHPVSCGLSNFRQHYARGQAFTYNLVDIGAYYTAYVRMMAHFDTLFPGRIHRVIHEHLIDDPEGQIRKILDYLELPFDEACLRFHENKRAVRTSSSEQVRRPINREGVDQWRVFEPWLAELKETLGPVLTSYPDVPPNIDPSLQ